MKFKVIQSIKQIDSSLPEKFYLIVDNWDDWFMFATTFTLVVVDTPGKVETIGSVKIGQRGLVPSGQNEYPDDAIVRSPKLLDEFDDLGDEYFSLAPVLSGLNRHSQQHSLSQKTVSIRA